MKKTREQKSEEFDIAVAELKAAFMSELTRLLTPTLNRMSAFLERHPALTRETKFTKFLDRVIAVQDRIWKWFWK